MGARGLLLKPILTFQVTYPLDSEAKINGKFGEFFLKIYA